ncbi:transmembrane protein 182-like isoform X3 [Ambystoma mexicanum]|uniref:transmembrane protein 182-like isoform X3 n=1 Tax=Ambystoma mexicanum TaxID=8296 RepID=UPI0037E75034
MKVGVAALCAGLVGGFGVLLFLVAFGTDYWLLAIENCGALESKGGTSHSTEVSLQESEGAALTFHHEGFFWRCWFNGDGYKETVWNFWFMNQAHPKHCIRGYLFPMPIETGPIPHPSYDATAGFLFSTLIVLFVIWKEFAANLQKYILLAREEHCVDDYHMNVYYGWSFMFAAAGIPLVMLSGLLFYLVGQSILNAQK